VISLERSVKRTALRGPGNTSFDARSVNYLHWRICVHASSRRSGSHNSSRHQRPDGPSAAAAEKISRRMACRKKAEQRFEMPRQPQDTNSERAQQQRVELSHHPETISRDTINVCRLHLLLRTARISQPSGYADRTGGAGCRAVRPRPPRSRPVPGTCQPALTSDSVTR